MNYFPIQKHIFHGKEYTFSLPMEKENNDHTFTILIGKNGCGKSRILTHLIDYNLKENKNIYKFIAASNIINDNFPKRKPRSSKYYYSGHKKNSNYDRFNIFRNILNEDNSNILKTFDYLKFQPNILISFSVKESNFPDYKLDIFSRIYEEHKDLVEKNLDPEFLDKIFNTYKKNILNTKIKEKEKYFSIKERIYLYYNKIQTDTRYSDKNIFKKSELIFLNLLTNIYIEKFSISNIDFINCYNILLNDDFFEKNTIHLEYNLIEKKYHLLKIISKLLDYEVLKIKKVYLYKYNLKSPISFDSLSSGEKSSFNLFLGIAGKIADNSLICIDEPEVNLHPSWQTEFILKLQDVFKNINNCHFIIATHSPQIVSGLKTDKGYILDVEKNKTYKSKQYTHTSVDSQLVELFHSPGYNNEYILKLCFRLISMIKDQEKFSDKDKEFINQLKGARKSLRDDDSSLYLINQVLSLVESQS
ncbi:AAA family ATPase [Acinetobacter pollinis]|uniref:AAA family ATPase n=1 Tax=Acinetobacter pollinis TaxID=2605270 RepID=UPI0018C2D0EC|nr:AAA family ATPase [Acinetobacter pollinis]MBF7693444.1 AAA family ATPase [Acinetobacter pollinis]MBF7700956.1 AAA family ATPase [Acinetobacter pollinis]